MDTNNEIGRELAIHELVPETVVVLVVEEYAYVTVWVEAITPHMVSFYAGVTRLHFIAFIQPDGTLKDDVGRIIKVCEYLGTI